MFSNLCFSRLKLSIHAIVSDVHAHQGTAQAFRKGVRFPKTISEISEIPMMMYIHKTLQDTFYVIQSAKPKRNLSSLSFHTVFLLD